jgi:hypothetical protein
MNGKKIKYYKYKNTSGRLNLPADIGELLDFHHKEKLNASIQIINGKTGLFITKENKKKENEPPNI